MLKKEEVAADLRERILSGEFPPGSVLPTILEIAARHAVSTTTARTVIHILRDEGLVTTAPKRGTVVRHPPVLLSLSRYQKVLRANSPRGPWEVACEAQGRSGETRMVAVTEEPAGDLVAGKLAIPPGLTVVRRHRHHLVDGRVIQVQTSIYSLDLIRGTGLTQDGVQGRGVYAVLIDAGHIPAKCSERIGTRSASPDERTLFDLEKGAPVLTIERITRDADGNPLELLWVISSGESTEFLYEDLPLKVQK